MEPKIDVKGRVLIPQPIKEKIFTDFPFCFSLISSMSHSGLGGCFDDHIFEEGEDE